MNATQRQASATRARDGLRGWWRVRRRIQRHKSKRMVLNEARLLLCLEKREIYKNWPASTNAIVGLSGQGTPAPYQQYTRRKLPVQVAQQHRDPSTIDFRAVEISSICRAAPAVADVLFPRVRVTRRTPLHQRPPPPVAMFASPTLVPAASHKWSPRAWYFWPPCAPGCTPPLALAGRYEISLAKGSACTMRSAAVSKEKRPVLMSK